MAHADARPASSLQPPTCALQLADARVGGNHRFCSRRKLTSHGNEPVVGLLLLLCCCTDGARRPGGAAGVAGNGARPQGPCLVLLLLLLSPPDRLHVHFLVLGAASSFAGAGGDAPDEGEEADEEAEREEKESEGEVAQELHRWQLQSPQHPPLLRGGGEAREVPGLTAGKDCLHLIVQLAHPLWAEVPPSVVLPSRTPQEEEP
mmetsp:Transcript_2967/g.10004  ORF Transcript_2967/g.10004 Transcript_2967/m.10004 type:complete len:204 (-) Transcript_2967:709-1320(-)